MSDLVIQGQSWIAMKEQATMLVRSNFLPDSIKTPEQAIAIAIKGHEIGMPMMQAFSQIHVIKGKPTISAEGMNALIRKNCPGAKLEILISNSERCTIRATRPGEQSCEFHFSIDDAKRAGLMSNPSWSKYPDAMLFSRCISIVARRVFPDCLCGISYTPEELGADVNEEGNIINVPHETPPKQELQKQIEPEVQGSEKYNSEFVSHKKILKEYAMRHGVSEKKTLLEFSERCVGIELQNLGAAISEILEEKNQVDLGFDEEAFVEPDPAPDKKPNPNQKNVEDVLSVIEDKLKKK